MLIKKNKQLSKLTSPVKTLTKFQRLLYTLRHDFSIRKINYTIRDWKFKIQVTKYYERMKINSILITYPRKLLGSGCKAFHKAISILITNCKLVFISLKLKQIIFLNAIFKSFNEFKNWFYDTRSLQNIQDPQKTEWRLLVGGGIGMLGSIALTAQKKKTLPLVEIPTDTLTFGSETLTFWPIDFDPTLIKTCYLDVREDNREIEDYDPTSVLNGLKWNPLDHIYYKSLYLWEYNQYFSRTYDNWIIKPYILPEVIFKLTVKNSGQNQVHVTVLDTANLGHFAVCSVPTYLLTGLGIFGLEVITEPHQIMGVAAVLYAHFAIEGSILSDLLLGFHGPIEYFATPGTVKEIILNQKFILNYGGLNRGAFYTLIDYPIQYVVGKSFSSSQIHAMFFEWVSKPKMAWIDSYWKPSYWRMPVDKIHTKPLNSNYLGTIQQKHNLINQLRLDHYIINQFQKSVASKEALEAQLLQTEQNSILEPLKTVHETKVNQSNDNTTPLRTKLYLAATNKWVLGALVIGSGVSLYYCS